MDGIPMTFGEKLTKLRLEHNMSQEQMAEMLDVSRQSISKWESDKSFPELKRLIFICKHFDTSLDYLVLNEEPQIVSEINPDKTPQYRSSLNQCLVTLLDNLNPKQKRFLYTITVILIISATLFFCYSLGYGLGKFLYYVTH